MKVPLVSVGASTSVPTDPPGESGVDKTREARKPATKLKEKRRTKSFSEEFSAEELFRNAEAVEGIKVKGHKAVKGGKTPLDT